MALSRQLGVGIIGAGEVAQVVHLPVLSLLSHLYTVHIVCDVSAKLAQHCATKFHVPKATTNPEEVFASSAVNVVLSSPVMSTMRRSQFRRCRPESMYVFSLSPADCSEKRQTE